LFQARSHRRHGITPTSTPCSSSGAQCHVFDPEVTPPLQILALLSKTSLDRGRFVITEVLRRCFSHSSPQTLLLGRSLFDGIPAPYAFLWNTLLRACLLCRIPAESLRLLRKVRTCEGVALDSFSLSLALWETVDVCL
ncbi:hypothetical protein BHE74_00038179, partial [Ensete ventricosum]